jgi:hypothetical protein
MEGGKKLQPNVGFSLKRSVEPGCAGKKKLVWYPQPHHRSPSSAAESMTSGRTKAATVRNRVLFTA